MYCMHSYIILYLEFRNNWFWEFNKANDERIVEEEELK